VRSLCSLLHVLDGGEMLRNPLFIAAAIALPIASVSSVVACSTSGPVESVGPSPSGPQDASGGPHAAPEAGDSGGFVEPDTGHADAANEGGDDSGDDTGGAGPGDTGPADAPPAQDASPSGLHAVLIWGYGEHLPTPKPTDPLEPLDVDMKALLEAKGLTVDLAVDLTSTVADVTGKALFVISSSVNRNNLTSDGTPNGVPRFKDVPVPGIVMKDGVIEVMGLGMGGSGGFSTQLGQNQLTIVNPGDPLAAGLMGTVTVYTTMCGQPCATCYTGKLMCTDRIIYSFPALTAKRIATLVGMPFDVGIYAYQKGDLMANGFPAPAKRMAFFIHRDTDYSQQGKMLFDAAVDYLLAP
jgi:hypothetical protein